MNNIKKRRKNNKESKKKREKILKPQKRLQKNNKKTISDKEFIGKVSHVNEHIAYIICDKRDQDILVKGEDLATAMHGDYVQVVVKYSRGNKTYGYIDKILERSKNLKICTLSEKKGRGKSAEKFLFTDIILENESDFELNEHIKFGVAITSWNKKLNLPQGKIKKILGEIGEHETEIHSIMMEFGLEDKFSKEILEEAKDAERLFSQKEIMNRRNFINETTFTIDPKDAKDFDDALSLKKLEDGTYEIGIHIADVSHFVKENSEIDKEAYKRGCTVYLVDRTVPMLPENLCNDLCSLVPNKERLTCSVVVKIDEDANIHNVWFGETVIQSKKRFTYEDAEKILDQKNGEFYEELNILKQLSKKLNEKRQSKGAINFITKEFYFEMDENNNVKSIEEIKSLSTHSLIEEFMVLANNQVASFIRKVSKKKNILPFRVHEDPNPDKLLDFYNFLNNFPSVGKIPKKGSDSEKINFILEKVKGTPQEFLIHNMAIRSMAKAIYSHKHSKHYGLGLSDYAHFTSPIRRYPDLMVHRVLKNYKKDIDPIILEKKCKYLSEREVIATSAERASIKYKQVEFAKKFVNETLEGMITGFSEKNIFVELKKSHIEGAIEIDSITDDIYKFIKNEYSVIGKNFGKRYQMGDILNVRITNCDLIMRKVELSI